MIKCIGGVALENIYFQNYLLFADPGFGEVFAEYILIARKIAKKCVLRKYQSSYETDGCTRKFFTLQNALFVQ
jgi:hypothetical protein